MTVDSSFDRLPPDLRELAEALMAHRDEADGFVLDRVQRRVQSNRPSRIRRVLPGLRRTKLATVLAVFVALNVTGGVALACSTGAAGQVISTIVSLCNPSPPPSPPAKPVYCPPGTISYNSQGKIVTNGTGTVCCPQGQNSWFSSDDKGSVCCPSQQNPWFSSDDKTSGCCPNQETGYASSDDKDSVCCPSQQKSWFSSDDKTSGCCPNQETGYASSDDKGSVCCPTQQNPWFSSDDKTSGCCPNQETGYASSDDKDSVCCPSQQNAWFSSNDQSSGCCPNSTQYTSSNNACCPKQSNSTGYLTPSNTGIPKGCCPPNTKISFRWHYSGNTGGSSWSSGSWSGTTSNTYGSSWNMGPQAMEGALKVSPGTSFDVGYDLSVPGNNSLVSFTVTNPQIVFKVACVSGTPTATTFTATMPSQEYAFTDSSWYPTGTQSSSTAYEGSITVPNLCKGGQLLLSSGGTFSASVS